MRWWTLLMQLIIPMTGQGSRFVDAGYERLKPFILVHDVPIIAWVLKMFPGIEEHNIHFILQSDHFHKHSYIKTTLDNIAPKSNIHLIDHYDARGPLPNILKISESLQDRSPVWVSYCDFYMRWNFHATLQYLTQTQADGAIPCYTGFHPHLISSPNFYACCRSDANGNLIEVREKYSFTEDKTKSLHSPGVYYFKSGALLKKYFEMAMSLDLSTNGEFYCSLPFNLMVRDHLQVKVTNSIEHFCQWGTPQDLAEYLSWYEHIQGLKLRSKVDQPTLEYWKKFIRFI
jgi:NDP-sugar pyrophosphorylase family protein